MKNYTSEFNYNGKEHKAIIVSRDILFNDEKLSQLVAYFDRPMCFIIIHSTGFEYIGEGTEYFKSNPPNKLKWTPSKVS